MCSVLISKIKGKFWMNRNLSGIVTNSVWMFVDKLLRQGGQFLLAVWITRYLGPERFGVLSYASAFVSLFLAISNLGLYGVVVRDVVRYPDERHEILGTALFLKVIGGITCMCVAVSCVKFLRPDEPLIMLLVGIIAFSLVFQACDVFDFWFLSQLKSKNTLYVGLPAFILSAAVKISMILAQAPLEAFALVTVFDVFLLACGFLIVYQHSTHELGRLRVRWSWVRRLLGDSWPLVFAGLMVMVYTRIDQVMLGQMLGNRELGVYAAAARIAEFWYIIPIIILQSLFSTMVNAREQKDESYYEILQWAFDTMALMSYLFILFMFLFAGTIMTVLYGDAYVEGGRILAVYVVSGIFVMLGHVREYWVTMENITRLSLYSTGLGALVNVGLNYVLIPAYGAVGAAYATLIALFCSSYLVNLILLRTFRIFCMQTQALLIVPAILRLKRRLDSSN